MRGQQLILVAILGLTARCTCAQVGPSGLQIHLPREVTVNENPVHLGRICLLRGDPNLVAEANSVSLGSVLLPYQKLTFSRPMILGRLASCGVAASDVTFTGALEVTAQKTHQVIKGQDLMDLATAYLRENVPDPCSAVIEVQRTVADWLLDQAGKSTSLVCRLGPKAAGGRVRVRIAAVADGRDLDARDIEFRVQYHRRMITAKGPIPKDQPLTHDNCLIQEGLGDRPQPADWTPPLGQLAKRPIPDGAEIRAEWLQAPMAPVSVKHNEMVTIRIDRPGMTLSVTGLALTDARTGDFIKVRNVDSNRIILCKLKEDGTVEPVL